MASALFCEPCQTEEDLSSPAVKWCTECEEPLCEECVRSHRKSKASKHHTLIDPVSYKSLPKIKVQECKVHTEQKLDLFCVDHDDLCCRLCMTENHRSCAKVITIDVAAKDIKSSAMLSHIIDRAENQRQCFDDFLKETESEKEAIDKQQKDIINQLSSYKKHIIDCLEDAEKSLTAEILKTSTDRTQNVTKVQESLSIQKDKLESFLTSIKAMSDNGSNEQVFLLAQHLNYVLTESEKVVENQDNRIKRQVMSFESNKDIICSENILGKINIASNAECSIDWSLPQAGAQTTGLTSDGTVQSSSDKKKKPVFCARFESLGHHKIRGIAVTGDGNVLLCDHKSTYVLQYTSGGKFINSCDVERHPWNIALLEDSTEAVVSLTGNLQLASVITVSGYLKFIDIKQMCRIRELRLDYSPLAIATAGSDIVVGTWNFIQFLDKSGICKRQIDISRNRFALTYLFIAETNSDTSIYYSTSELSCIRKDGSLIQTFNFIYGRPRGICADDRGFIFLATMEGELLKLSPEGKLCEILLHGNEDFGPLWAMSFNHDYTKLYVVTENGKSVFVFEFK